MNQISDVDVTASMPSTAEIEALVDLLIAGKYQDVPEGTTDLERKLYTLATTLHGRATMDLERMVAFSTSCNDAVESTAKMMRAIREEDSRTNAISAAAEEMVASIQEISRNCDEIVGEAEQARDAVNSAGTASDHAVRSMERISTAVELAASKVESLAEASGQIGDIVQQIETIAKQTNLLALNATIEAARAGDAGKGFAVVAGEVKTLANQTAGATVDIRSRIEMVREEIDAIVVSMEDGAQAVEQGREVISSAGQEMADVLTRTNTVTDKMRDVAEILNQQMEAAREISEGITTIARMSTENVHGIDNVLDVMDSADALVMDGMNSLSQISIADFMLHVAKSDHMIWRTELTEMISGRKTLHAAELHDHHACRFGHWYDSIKDSSVTNHPAFKALAEPHRQVHSAGIEAAKLHEKGDLDGAMACLDQVGQASQEVVRLLDALIKRGTEQ